MIARLAVVSLGLCGAFVVACGSSDKGDLFKGNGGGYAGTANAGSGGATTGGSSGDGGVVNGGTGGVVNGGTGGGVTGGAAGAPLGGAGGSTGGVGGTGGEPLGGAGGSLGGAGNTGGTGGVIVTSSVSCDGQTCTIPGTYCCQTYDFQVNDWMGSCLASGGGCTIGSSLFCDGPEDCNSFDDCCGTISNFAGNDYYSSFKCVPKGQCDYTDSQRIICGGTPSACPVDSYCASSSLLPGYKACVPQ